MAYEPLMDGSPQTNVYGEHTFRVRATLGAGTAVTYRSKDATLARGSTSTLTITLPKPYTEITDYNCGRFAAVGVAGLEYIVSDQSNLATTGVIVLTSINSAGAATAGASGDVCYITLSVSCDPLNNVFTG